MSFLHTGRAALWRFRFPRVPFSPIRCLNSGDSDDDFKPKRKNLPDLSDVRDAHALIEDHVKSHPVMLYMKGTPAAPQCGFSQQVVRLLDATGKCTAYLQVYFQLSLIDYIFTRNTKQDANSVALMSSIIQKFGRELNLFRTYTIVIIRKYMTRQRLLRLAQSNPCYLKLT